MHWGESMEKLLNLKADILAKTISGYIHLRTEFERHIKGYLNWYAHKKVSGRGKPDTFFDHGNPKASFGNRFRSKLLDIKPSAARDNFQ